MKSISSPVSESSGNSDSSTPRGSTNHFPATTPTDEPIHIINIGLCCDDIAELDDTLLSAQCVQFVQVRHQDLPNACSPWFFKNQHVCIWKQLLIWAHHLKGIWQSYLMHVLILKLDTPNSSYGLSKLVAETSQFWHFPPLYSPRFFSKISICVWKQLLI